MAHKIDGARQTGKTYLLQTLLGADEPALVEAFESQMQSAAAHTRLIDGYRRDFGKYAGKADAKLIESAFNGIPAQLSAHRD